MAIIVLCIYIRQMGDGSLEVGKIIHCLTRNGYRLTDVSESDEYQDSGVATFSKDVEFGDAHGNYINDTPIVVKITFDPRMDMSFIYDEDDFEYKNSKVHAFVSKIIKGPQTKKNTSTRKSSSSISSLSSGSHSSSRRKSNK